LFTDILEKDEFPPQFDELFPFHVRDQDDNLTTVPRISFQTHQQFLAAMREYFMDAMLDITDVEFRRVRSFKDYQVTPQWVIHHLMQHEAVNRGQIMTIGEAGEKLLQSW
jgi:hypothetical protein